jgi:very-short-patch-repair endonuclease
MPELHAVTARLRAQRGLITREQAIAAGLGPGAVDNRIRSGRWEVVHPAVYRLVGVPRTWHQDALAATLWMERHGTSVLSHLAALSLWGLGDGRRRPALEVTVAHATRPRSGPVDVHRTNHLPVRHVASRLGISVTSVERTLLDCAGRISRGRLELAVEDALRLRLTSAGDLDAIIDEMHGRRCRRVGVLRELLDARRAGGEGAAHGNLELATWRLITSSGLPRPRRQHVVTVEAVDWSLDFYWPEQRVGLETDGYAAHQGLTAFQQDRRKLRALASAGCHVLPATWDDVIHRPDALVRDIERALRRAA